MWYGVQYNPDQFPGLHYKLADTRPAAPQLTVKAEQTLTHAPRPASTAVESAAAASNINTATTTPATTSAVSPVSSSLTLTMYFSGRFTLVGAQHESDVYTHFEHITRALFPFSQMQMRQQQSQGHGGQGQDNKQQLTYEVWLADSRREERAKGGRMGWEDEADRVRMEMDKRERKRREHMQRPHNNDGSTTASGQQQQRVSVTGGEVRVKAEPGTAVLASESATCGEMKEEAVAVTGHPSVEADRELSNTVGGKRGLDEFKCEEQRSMVGGATELIEELGATVVVALHAGDKEEKSGEADDDVEWE